MGAGACTEWSEQTRAQQAASGGVLSHVQLLAAAQAGTHSVMRTPCIQDRCTGGSADHATAWHVTMLSALSSCSNKTVLAHS